MAKNLTSPSIILNANMVKKDVALYNVVVQEQKVLLLEKIYSFVGKCAINGIFAVRIRQLTGRIPTFLGHSSTVVEKNIFEKNIF
jgi:hypothetical protein